MKQVASCWCLIAALAGVPLAVFVKPSGRAAADEGPLSVLKKALEDLHRAIMTAPGAAAKDAPRQADAALPKKEEVLPEFVRQFEPAFKRLYVSELHFMRMSSRATRPQYEKIAEECKPALTTAIKNFAKAMQEQMNPGNAMSREPGDPRRTISDELVKSVKKNLSAEQAANYQKELDQRHAARKKAIVLNLLFKIDQILFLTQEQRDSLQNVLTNNWNSSWHQMQWLEMEGGYLPPMPDSKITPLLTQTQRKVWSGVQKGNIFFGFDEVVDGGFAVDESWEDRPAEKNKPAPDKKAVKDKGAAKQAEKK
jgi:hypothetical protein